MPDELARRTHALFVRALDVEAPKRDAFVSSSCAGDTALEARVRRLLAAVSRSTTFLETPALATRGARRAGPAAAPATICVHGYRLIRVLGAGGMATVFEAEQETPRRTVALKVMSHALTSTSAVRRFRYETEILARLQHPGIAQIYEVGTCNDTAERPLPYFAMEYVAEARPITDYADARGLALRDRLALLATVCDAVQHGHQLGVIHRDLKPANILVDAAGRPKVIDFGVAKTTGPGQPDLTQRVDTEQLIGTLNFMSPEQCTSGAALDVRADVYALGVVLYQLVAGRLPYDLQRAAIPEALRIITQVEPRPLSAYTPAARGDLDAIARMAIEKDPARRYASAGALAADLRRYLKFQPVDARPTSTLDHLGKFARRHRGVVGAVAAVFLTLVVGIASTARMAYVAQQARAAAEARERELERVTAFQESQLSGIDVPGMGEHIRAALLDGAQAARDRDDAPDADAAAFERTLSRVNFTTLAMRTIDEDGLQRSHAAILEQFADQPVVQARLLQRLAGTMNQLGLREQARPVLEASLRIRMATLGPDDPDTLLSLHSMGSLLASLGHYDEAVAMLRDAYARRARVHGPTNELTLRTATSLGGALRKQGDLAGAERVWGETLACQRRILGPDHPDTLRSLNNIGVIYAVQGKLAEAEAAWRELLERRRRLLGDDHPDYLGSLGNLAMVLQDEGRAAEARPLLEAELAANRRNQGDDHPDTLTSMGNLAALLLEADDLAGAERLFGECAERRQRTLGPEHPSTLAVEAALASTWRALGHAQIAETVLRDVLDTQRRLLGEDHPDALDTRVGLIAALLDLRRFDEAITEAATAVSSAQRVFPDGHWMIAHCRVQLGRALTARGDLAPAWDALIAAYDSLCDSRGRTAPTTRAAAEALADCAAARHRVEPDGGYGAQASAWRARAAPPAREPGAPP